MPDKTQMVIGIVHELDGLERDREKLVARIAALKAELSKLIGGSHAHSGNGAVKRRGRPVGGYGDKIVTLLQREPGTDLGKLAREIYSEDNPRNRHRVRAQLSMLKDRGRVKRVGPSEWHAVDTEATM